MKKILLICCLAAFGVAAQAQTTAVQASATTVVSKEEKARQKAQQEQDLADAFKAAGLSDAQITSAREALDAASKANRELKANTSLSDEQKEEAKKKISDEKNARLKEIMGAEAYRKFNAARKEQKARSEANAGK